MQVKGIKYFDDKDRLYTGNNIGREITITINDTEYNLFMTGMNLCAHRDMRRWFVSQENEAHIIKMEIGAQNLLREMEKLIDGKETELK